MVYYTFDSMPLVLEVRDIADTLRIGRNRAYELVNSGKIKAVKVGNLYRVSRDSFISFINGETEDVKKLEGVD